jgi:hypothetical protein
VSAIPAQCGRDQGCAQTRLATDSAVGSPQSNVAVGCASSHGGCDAPPDDRHRPRPARTSAHDARCVCNDDIDAAILPLAASDSSSGAVSGTMWDTTSCVRVARVCGHDAHCTCGASYTHRMAPNSVARDGIGWCRTASRCLRQQQRYGVGHNYDRPASLGWADTTRIAHAVRAAPTGSNVSHRRSGRGRSVPAPLTPSSLRAVTAQATPRTTPRRDGSTRRRRRERTRRRSECHSRPARAPPPRQTPRPSR